MAKAFQSNAFQNNAFQTATGTIREVTLSHSSGTAVTSAVTRLRSETLSNTVSTGSTTSLRRTISNILSNTLNANATISVKALTKSKALSNTVNAEATISVKALAKSKNLAQAVLAVETLNINTAISKPLGVNGLMGDETFDVNRGKSKNLVSLVSSTETIGGVTRDIIKTVPHTQTTTMASTRTIGIERDLSSSHATTESFDIARLIIKSLSNVVTGTHNVIISRGIVIIALVNNAMETVINTAVSRQRGVNLNNTSDVDMGVTTTKLISKGLSNIVTGTHDVIISRGVTVIALLSHTMSTAINTALVRQRNIDINYGSNSVTALQLARERFESFVNTSTVTISTAKRKVITKPVGLHQFVGNQLVTAINFGDSIIVNLTHSLQTNMTIAVQRVRAISTPAVSQVDVVTPAVSRLRLVTVLLTSITNYILANPYAPDFIAYRLNCSRQIKMFFKPILNVRL